MEGIILSNRYRLEKELGRGGMGAVYRAYDTLLDRPVAVKILSQAGSGSEGSQGHVRLLREAQAAARLNHPNIVTVYDAGQSEELGVPYIVMELVAGQSLRQVPPADWPQLVAIARQIGLALEQAHAHDIIHRDLKPENILVTPTQRIKLMDFGLARLNSAPRLTVEGALVGTFAYMAPETIQGGAPSPQSDLYALGIILYELLAGQPPFSGEGVTAVLSQHLFAPVTPPSVYNEAIPTVLDRLVLRLLSKNPAERPSSATELLQLLAELDGSQSTATALAADISPLDRLTRGRLVARQQELATAFTHWHNAVAGNGGVLLISGEPGIGKSRLVQELTVRAGAMRGQTLLGECYPEGGLPYAPLAQALRRLFTPEDNQLPELSQGTLTGLATLIPDLTTRFPHITPHQITDPALARQRLFDSVATLFTTLSRERAVLLVIDDLHWADAGTLSLLRYLARQSRQQPLLIVLTYREIELNESHALRELFNDLNRDRLAHRLKLNRLDRDQTEELLTILLADKITPEFLESIYQETEGNPFFIEEICKALIDAGKLYREDGRWQRPENIADLEMPQSIRVAIQTRLARLPQSVQETLTLAAIIGRTFTFDTLLATAELDEDQVIEVLETAEKAQLINEVDHAGGGTFTFAHALIPATLAESISGLRRRRLHRRVAAIIEQLIPDNYPTLAYHYAAAAQDEQAGHFYRQAGDQALAAYANEDAAHYYRAALEFEPPPPIQAYLLAVLGESCSRQGMVQEAIQLWDEAIPIYQQVGNIDQVARLYARSAYTIWYRGETEKGIERCRQGLTVIDGQPETAGVAQLLHEAARTFHFAGLADEAHELCQRALILGQTLDLVEVQAHSLITLALLEQKSLQKYISILQEAIALAEAADLWETASRAYNNLGVLYHRNAAFTESAACSRQGLAIARRTGFLNYELWYAASLAWDLFFLAEFEEMDRLFEQIADLMSLVNDTNMVTIRVRGTKAYLSRARGQFDWLADVEAAAAESRHLGSSIGVHQINIVLGDAYMELGQLEQARTTLAEAWAVNPKFRESVTAGAYYIRLLIQMGELDEAQQLLTACQEELDENPQYGRFSQLHLNWAATALAAATENWPEANRLYESLTAELAQLGMRWYQATLLREWATALAKMDDTAAVAQIATLLAKAETLFTTIKVPYYANLARQERMALSP